MAKPLPALEITLMMLLTLSCVPSEGNMTVRHTANIQ